MKRGIMKRGIMNTNSRLWIAVAIVLLAAAALGAAAPEFPFAPIGHGGPAYMGSFVFYRILGGIGVGLASMLSPMYIAEIAPPKVRGNLVAWNQFAIIFGMLVIYFVNYGISRAGSGDAWIIGAAGWERGRNVGPRMSLFPLWSKILPDMIPNWQFRRVCAPCVVPRRAAGRIACCRGWRGPPLSFSCNPDGATG